MAILSPDTYLKKEIERNLKSILGNSYITREVILKDFDESVKSSFINAYCTDVAKDKALEVPVVYTFPPQKQVDTGVLLIQYKGATEFDDSHNAIGQRMGTIDDTEGNVTKETVDVHTEKTSTGNSVAYLEMAHPVKEVLGIQKISSSKISIVDNRIYVAYNPIFEQHAMNTLVIYVPEALQDDGKPMPERSGEAIGYDLMENYTIDVISNNMDTLRCLDAVMKTILIFMRQNVTEQVEYRLQRIHLSGMDQLEQLTNAQNSSLGNQLFFRRIEISYDVTYSILDSTGFEINQLLMEAETDVG